MTQATSHPLSDPFRLNSRGELDRDTILAQARVPAGSSKGGQFARKGGGAASTPSLPKGRTMSDRPGDPTKSKGNDIGAGKVATWRTGGGSALIPGKPGTGYSFGFDGRRYDPQTLKENESWRSAAKDARNFAKRTGGRASISDEHVLVFVDD